MMTSTNTGDACVSPLPESLTMIGAPDIEFFPPLGSTLR